MRIRLRKITFLKNKVMRDTMPIFLLHRKNYVINKQKVMRDAVSIFCLNKNYSACLVRFSNF